MTNETLAYICLVIFLLLILVLGAWCDGTVTTGRNEITQIVDETRDAASMPAQTTGREYIVPVVPPHPLRHIRSEQTSKYTSLGTFNLTVYTPHCDGGIWGYQTASGVRSEHLATCAVDPAVIPLGTVIDVGGIRVKAVDTGSAVKGNVIDIFFDGRTKDALDWLRKFGTRQEVTLVPEGEIGCEN